MDEGRVTGKERTVAERLRRLYRETSSKRWQWVRQWREAEPDADTLLILLHLLDDRDRRVRQEVLEALWTTGGTPARVAARTLLQDPDYMTRLTAADVLGELGDRQDVPRLIAALQDPKWEVRSSAAIALGLLGGQSACKAVCTALPLERHRIPRRDLAFALSEIRGPEAQAAAAQQFARECSELVRAGLLWALYRCGEPDRLAEYLAFLDSPDDLIRINVVNGLDMSALDPGERTRVIERLRHVAEHDEDYPTRSSAEALLKGLD